MSNGINTAATVSFNFNFNANGTSSSSVTFGGNTPGTGVTIPLGGTPTAGGGSGIPNFGIPNGMPNFGMPSIGDMLLGQIALNTGNTNKLLEAMTKQMKKQEEQIKNLMKLLNERLEKPKTPGQIKEQNKTEANKLADDIKNQATFLAENGDGPNQAQTKSFTGKALDAILKKGGLSNVDQSKLEALKSQLDVATTDEQVNQILGEVIGFVLDKVNIDSLDIPQIEKTNLKFMKRKMSEKPDELLGGTSQFTQRDAFRALAAALKSM